jgi:tetratricopeptide (TPR) repeat protein
MFRNRYTLTIILACLLPVGRCLAAEQKWLRAASQNFELYTTENEAKARAALDHFEAVRAYFLKAVRASGPAGEPIRIVAFRSEGDYLPYRPPGMDFARAFSQTGGVRSSIVMMNLASETYEQGFREYVRMVLSDSAAAFPYWLRTGLTEVYATLSSVKGQIKLGTPPRRTNAADAPVDLVVLVSMQDRSRGGGVGSQRDSLNDELPNAAVASTQGLVNVASASSVDWGYTAWALTHMLMFNKDYAPKFSALVQAVAGGKATGTAFGEVYGRSLGQVSSDLNLYRRMSLPFAMIPFQSEKVAVDIRQATPFESGILLADLTAGTLNGEAKSKEAYQKLAAQDPKSWQPAAGLGYLALRAGDREEARRQFSRAIELGCKETSVMRLRDAAEGKPPTGR